MKHANRSIKNPKRKPSQTSLSSSRSDFLHSESGFIYDILPSQGAWSFKFLKRPDLLSAGDFETSTPFVGKGSFKILEDIHTISPHWKYAKLLSVNPLSDYLNNPSNFPLAFIETLHVNLDVLIKDRWTPSRLDTSFDQTSEAALRSAYHNLLYHLCKAIIEQFEVRAVLIKAHNSTFTHAKIISPELLQNLQFKPVGENFFILALQTI